MAYGLSKYNQYSSSYLNKKRAVRSTYQPQHLTGSMVKSSQNTEREYSRINKMDTSYVEQKKRSTLDRIFDAMQIGQFIVQGNISAIVDKDPTTTMLGNTIKAIKSANPFGDDYTEGEYTFRDNLDHMTGYEAQTGIDKAGRFIVGLAGDILLDPTTYMTFGLASLSKGSGTVRKFGGAVDDVVKGLSKADAYGILSKANLPRSSENINKLISSTNKYAGITKEGSGIGIKLGKFQKTFVDDKTLKLLADKTTAPYVNSFVDYVQASKVGQLIDKSSSLKQLAKRNPNEAARLLTAIDLIKGHSDDVLKTSASIKRRVKKFTSEFTPDELIELTGLIEDSNAFGRSAIKVDVNDSIEAKKLFERFTTTMDTLDSKISKLETKIGSSRAKVDEITRAVNGEKDTILERYNNLQKTREELVLTKKNLEEITTMGLPNGRRTIEVRQSLNLADEIIPTTSRLDEPLQFLSDSNEFLSGLDSTELRKYYKSNKVARGIDIPYGITPVGDTMQAKNIKLGNISDLKSVSASEYLLKGHARQPRGTSNKFVRTKLDAFKDVSEKEARGLVDKLIKNNPLLASDFERAKLSTRLSKSESERFLKLYMDEPAENLIKRLDEFKEGYHESLHILTEQGFGHKLKEQYDNLMNVKKSLSKYKLGSAEGKAINRQYLDMHTKYIADFKEHKSRLSRLLIDEDTRIADWAEFLNKREIPYGKSKVPGQQAKIATIKGDLRDLQAKMASGLDDEAVTIRINKLQHQLKKEVDKLGDLGKTDKWAREFDANNWITKTELDAILQREGFGNYRDNPFLSDLGDEMRAIRDDAYFDPMRDIEVGAKKEVVDKFHPKKPDGVDVNKLNSLLNEPDRKLLIETKANISKKLDEIIELKRQPIETINESFRDSKIEQLRFEIGQDTTTVTSLYNSVVVQAGGLNPQARTALNYLKKNAYTTQQADEVSKLLGLDSVYEKVTAIAADAKLPMQTHFEFKLGALKQYFPEKKFSDLSPKEIDFLEGITEKAVRDGNVRPSWSGKNKELRLDRLKELDVQIKHVDFELAAVSERVDLIKNGYFLESTENGKKAIQAMKELDELKPHEVKLEELVKRREIIRAKVDASNVETFIKSTMSEERAKNLLTKMSDTEGFFDPDVEKRFGAVARAFKEEMAKIASIEELGFTWDNYVLHLVKDEHKGLFYKDQAFNELASKLGIGKEMYNTSKLKRQFKTTIADYKALWDIGAVDNTKFPRDLFEENAAQLWVTRMLNSNKIINDKANHQTILDLVGRKLPNDKYYFDKDSFKSVLKEGEVFAISTRDVHNYDKQIREINKANAKVGGKRFDEMSEVFKAIDPDYDLIRDGFFRFKDTPDMSIFTPEMVSAIKQSGIITSSAVIDTMNYGSKFQYGEGMRSFLDIYDKMLHLWKLNVTAVNPNFHIRNAFGNTFNNYLDIGKDVFDPKLRGNVINIIKGGDGEIITKTGKKIKYDEVYSAATDLGIFDTSFYGTDIRSLLEHKGVATKWSKFIPFDSTEFLPYKIGTKTGSMIESFDRMINFVWHVQDGKSYSHALEMTNHFLFDYSKATEFEKEVMRRVIPFWTWMKNNIPLQAEQMLNQPSKYLPFAKMKTALTASVPEDQRVDRNYVNDFALDWWQLPFEVTNEVGRKEPVMVNPNMPYQDISTDLKDLIGKLSPFIKVPVELLTNRHSFYDQPIYTDLGSAPIKTVDHIMSQLTPYNVGKSVIRKSGTDRMLEILAYFGGVRVMSYDAEKYKYMQIQEQMRGKRK